MIAVNVFHYNTVCILFYIHSMQSIIKFIGALLWFDIIFLNDFTMDIKVLYAEEQNDI